MLAKFVLFLLIIGFNLASIIIFVSPFFLFKPQYAILATIAILIVYRIRFPFEFNGYFQIKSLRESRIFKYIGAQYNWKTIYISKLDVNKRYMFSLAPHGIYPISWMFFMFQLTSLGFHPLLLAGDIMFRLPMTREFALMLGAVNASWKSIKNAAANDRSVINASGASREMIYSGRSKGVIHIVKRTAFLKAALMYGYTLVPVVGVGVDELYRAYVLPWEWFKNILGFFPFVSMGKYEMFYPRDANVYHVVGEPIPVTLNENPSGQDLEQLSDKFYQGLEAALEFYNKNYDDNVKIEYIKVEKKLQAN